MRLTAGNARQSTSMNLNGLQNCVQENIEDLSGNAIVKE